MCAMTDYHALGYVEFARPLLLSCGRKLRDMRKNSVFSVQEKHGHSDIVTDHDLWVQEYLTSRLLDRNPDHGVIGEEKTGPRGVSDWSWVIDPIDGTTNYCQYGRDYAISLALLYKGVPYYGMVLDVEREHLYEGGGLPIDQCLSRDENPRDGILHMGFKTMRDFTQLGADPYALAESFRGMRYSGCASLELCGISEEKCGLYVNTHLKLWDFAGAYAILQSRNCRMAVVRMVDDNYFVCAFRSPNLFHQCCALFPEMIQQKLNETGGIFTYASN